MKRYILLLLAVGFFIMADAQKNVHPLPLDSNHTVKGATCRYMLPTTGFKVTVSVTKVREIKGYYADYAESLLGLTNVIDENKTFYKVNEVAIEPVQLPDFNHAYLVELSKEQIKNNPLTTLNLTNTLIPEYDKGVQCYTTASTPIPDFFKNYSDPSFAEEEAAFVETKIIDGVVTQVAANHTKLVSKTNNQKAQEAADVISKSRKDRYSLVAGEQETAYSAEAIALMINELKQWEENYLSLFTGLVLEDELLYTFYISPDKASHPLFSFDPTHGLSTENLTGNAVYQLNFTPVLQGEKSDLLAPQSGKEKKIVGYRFRKALPVNVKLTLQGKEIHNYGEFNMSQFGEIQTLPAGQDKLNINEFGFVF